MRNQNFKYRNDNPDSVKNTMKNLKAKPKIESEKTMNAPTPEIKKPDWKVNGWLNRNKSGNTLIASGIDDDTGESFIIGFISIKTLEKVLRGEISGVPIKTPPEMPDAPDE